MAKQYKDHVIAQAQYPETTPYPDASAWTDEGGWEKYQALEEAYFKQRSERLARSEGYRDGLDAFYGRTVREMLVLGENKNRVYSPLNLYMALSMLAELTDGNTRGQLLALLGAKDMEAVRESVSGLWEANYAADGIVTCVLANSVWLQDGIRFVAETMRRLADTYHASSFQGDMASKEFTAALKEWITEQTGGLLQEQAASLRPDPQTVLTLVSTVYYRARWAEPFLGERTGEGSFHAASGDIVCDFMNRKASGNYYRGKNFSAVHIGLSLSGQMWLLLPGAGTSVNEMVQGGDILRLIREAEDWADKSFVTVNLSMPKFDIASGFDLKESLRAMGVTDVFDRLLADFSPMLAQGGEVYLGGAEHAVRVMVDEQGCSAAAFTRMAVCAAGLPPREEVDFILNRPFVFAVTGPDGSILFMGAVEEPEGSKKRGSTG